MTTTIESPVGSSPRPAPSAPGGGSSPGPAGPVSLGLLAQLLFLGAVWGAAFLFLRVAAPEVGPVWAAEIRIAIGAGILVLIAGRRTWAIARHDLRAVAVAGAAFSAVPFTLIAIATLTLPTGLAAVLNASTPIFTALLGVVWLGQRLSIRLASGLVVGLAAVVLLVGWSPLPAGPATLIAIVAALGGAVSYAFAGTFVRRRFPTIGGVELATAQLVAGAIVLLPVAISTGAPGTASAGALVALIGVGTLSTALPWPIYLRILSKTTPTIASTVTFVVPAFAIAWGSIVLGEPIGLGLVAGFGLVIVSLVLVIGIRVGAPRLPALPLRWPALPVGRHESQP